jgi:dTDP-4-dehydrorhamnose reductase
MKILITGANGLLGYKLVQLLSQKADIQVIATGRRMIPDLPAPVTFYELDITDPIQSENAIHALKPEVIINTAAMTQVDQCEVERDLCWKANVTGVENLVTACTKNQTHLVHVSTDFIFDGSHGPLDEMATPKPVNFYGESKLAGEKVVQQSAISWTILRTVLVYGLTPDMSRSNIVLWVKKSLEDGKTINVVNDQWRTPTLAEDLAIGCFLAAKKKARGIFNISGEELMTPYDIAIQTADFFHLNKSLINATDSSKFKQPAVRPLKTGFIITKAKIELGYLPHTFKEGLALISTQL